MELCNILQGVATEHKITKGQRAATKVSVFFTYRALGNDGKIPHFAQVYTHE